LILKIYLYTRTTRDSVTNPVRNAARAFLPLLKIIPDGRDIRVRSATCQTEGANNENSTRELRKDLSAFYIVAP